MCPGVSRVCPGSHGVFLPAETGRTVEIQLRTALNYPSNCNSKKLQTHTRSTLNRIADRAAERRTLRECGRRRGPPAARWPYSTAGDRTRVVLVYTYYTYIGDLIGEYMNARMQQ